MNLPLVFSAILLALAETSITTVSPDSTYSLEEARQTFDISREAHQEDASDFKAFEVIGCVTVWRAWSEMSKDGLVPARLLARIPELNHSNAVRMEAFWIQRLELIREQESMNAHAVQQDLTDRYNFELMEAREVVAGIHMQPELVFRAAGACQAD